MHRDSAGFFWQSRSERSHRKSALSALDRDPFELRHLFHGETAALASEDAAVDAYTEVPRMGSLRRIDFNSHFIKELFDRKI